MLDDIIAYDIAQGIRIPIHAAQDRLLPPGAGIASRLGAHPTSLALLISEQAFQEQAGIRRNALLSEQRTYPLLDLPKRRRPQRKRLLNRRCPRPRSSNHSCPWIQKPVKKATVMLGPDLSWITRQGAAYVDKIIRGARPGDLPVEQPTRYQVFVNLKTAKALGLDVPQARLARADEVIE